MGSAGATRKGEKSVPVKGIVRRLSLGNGRRGRRLGIGIGVRAGVSDGTRESVEWFRGDNTRRGPISFRTSEFRTTIFVFSLVDDSFAVCCIRMVGIGAPGFGFVCIRFTSGDRAVNSRNICGLTERLPTAFRDRIDFYRSVRI